MAKSEALDTIVAQIRESFGQLEGKSVQEQRAFLDQAFGGIRLAEDITVQQVSANGIPAEWIAAPNAGSAVVLYLHGGGYVIGSIASHRELVSRIARAAAARVLIIDYRLAPESPFPAAVDDAVSAYRFLLSQGVAAEQIAIAGDSAGGGLTLATLIALRDAGERLPACGVTLSAWTDLAITGESIESRAHLDPMVQKQGIAEMAGAYLVGADSQHPLASPLYADFTGLPPLLMQVGTAETLHDDTMRVADKARGAGVDVTVEAWEDMFHVFQSSAAALPEGQQAIEKIGAFVQARTRAAPTLR